MFYFFNYTCSYNSPLLNRALIWALLIFGISACEQEDDLIVPPPEEEPKVLTDEHEYFLKISLESELEDNPERVKKWRDDMRIYVVDTTYTELMDELDGVMAEINALSGGITLQRVSTQDESNYLIYFGDRRTYTRKYEPSASPLVEDNYGVFWIYWDDEYQIYQGSMYVDMERTQETNCQKHLLREELTQSLGLMQDSDDYPTSIFYQQWTCLPRYADIDKQLIRWQLSPDIEAGMRRDDLLALWGF
uniref:DUF2927 domain-containing protein n=1 Tax=Roseihalotalea indica TaxID=2867963 RepID=A0AA49GJK8_9BACT|nr:DUF2927 domain-containing protein [Tunicatimonas sp. TK19036]